MNDKSVFHALSIWMTLTYLCQLLWCGLLLGLCQSYLYCWSVWANQSHRLYLVSTHMYPSQSHSGLYGKEKKTELKHIFAIIANSYRTNTNELFSQAMCTEIVTNLKLKSFAVVKSWHKAVYQSLYHQWQCLLPNHCLQRPGSSTTEKNVHAINI